LQRILQIMGWWTGVEDTMDDVPVHVELNKAIISVKAKPEEITVALTALQAEEISYATFWEILVEGGWAREGVTAEEEQLEISRQSTPEPEVEAPA